MPKHVAGAVFCLGCMFAYSRSGITILCKVYASYSGFKTSYEVCLRFWMPLVLDLGCILFDDSPELFVALSLNIVLGWMQSVEGLCLLFNEMLGVGSMFGMKLPKFGFDLW